MKSVVLLSGGLDSATVLGIAVAAGDHVYPITVNYNQRHAKEIEHAQRVVGRYGKDSVEPLKTVFVSSIGFEGSALSTDKIDVPMHRDEGTMATGGVPVTYVPCRNTVLVALAASYAESLGAGKIYVGFNAVDYSGYPDCRAEFVEALNATLRVGSKNPAQIVAPIIGMTKVEIVRAAVCLGVPLQHTWSCYAGMSRPCGGCDSCIIRQNAFAAVGMKDPAL